MTESELTGKLMPVCREVMPFARVLKHSDRSNSGYPDFTCTWSGSTSWWEVKFYDNRMFKTPKQQTIECRRLAQQGTCFYIIYEHRDSEKRVRICSPSKLTEWRVSLPVWQGYNHRAVAGFIRYVHESMC